MKLSKQFSKKWKKYRNSGGLYYCNPPVKLNDVELNWSMGGIIKMKFSKKSRYGLTSLIDLSGHVALNSIAERNDISPQYLEQVFAALRRAGIVKSIKGPQGGYLLNHPAEKITVAEILEALDGTYHIADEDTAEESDCKGIAAAIQTRVIDEVNRQLDQILINLTLADLVKEYQEFEKYDESMYYI